MPDNKTITIDDKEYILDDLSDAARAQLVSLQFTDQEISRLQRQEKIAHPMTIIWKTNVMWPCLAASAIC